MGARQEGARHHVPTSVLGFKFVLELKLKVLFFFFKIVNFFLNFILFLNFT